MITNKLENTLYPLVEQDGSYYVLDLSFKWPSLFFGAFYNLFATVPVYKVDQIALERNDSGKKETVKQGKIILYAVIGTSLGKIISRIDVGMSPVLCIFIFVFTHIFSAYKHKKKPRKFNELTLTEYKAKYVLNNSFKNIIGIFLGFIFLWVFQNGLFLLSGFLFFTSEIESNMTYFIMHCIWIYLLYVPSVFHPTSEIGKYVIKKSISALKK